MERILNTIIAGALAFGIAGCEKVDPCERMERIAEFTVNQYNNALDTADVNIEYPVKAEDFIPKKFYCEGKLYDYEKDCKGRFMKMH